MSIPGPPDSTPEQTTRLLVQMIENLFSTPQSSPHKELPSLAERLFVPDKDPKIQFTRTARLLVNLMSAKTEKIIPSTTIKEKPLAFHPIKAEIAKPFLSPHQVRLAIEVLATLLPQQSAKEKTSPEKLKNLFHELIRAVGRNENDSSGANGRLPFPYVPETRQEEDLKKSIPLPFQKEKTNPSSEKITEKRSVTSSQEKESKPTLQKTRSNPLFSKHATFAELPEITQKKEAAPFKKESAPTATFEKQIPFFLKPVKESISQPAKSVPETVQKPLTKQSGERPATEIIPVIQKKFPVMRPEKVKPVEALPKAQPTESRKPVPISSEPTQSPEPASPNKNKTTSQPQKSPEPDHKPAPNTSPSGALPNIVIPEGEKAHPKPTTNLQPPIVTAGPFIIPPLRALISSKKKKKNEEREESDPERDRETD